VPTKIDYDKIHVYCLYKMYRLSSHFSLWCVCVYEQIGGRTITLVLWRFWNRNRGFNPKPNRNLQILHAN